MNRRPAPPPPPTDAPTPTHGDKLAWLKRTRTHDSWKARALARNADPKAPAAARSLAIIDAVIADITAPSSQPNPERPL